MMMKGQLITQHAKCSYCSSAANGSRRGWLTASRRAVMRIAGGCYALLTTTCGTLLLLNAPDRIAAVNRLIIDT